MDENFISRTVSFPEEMVEYLDKEAAKRDMTRSQLVRLVIREYQDKKEAMALAAMQPPIPTENAEENKE